MTYISSLSPKIPIFVNEKSEADALRFLKFFPGEIVEAYIVGKEPGGGYYLRIKGYDFLVNSPLSLFPGMGCQLKVKEVSPHLVFLLLKSEAFARIERRFFPLFPHATSRFLEIFSRGEKFLSSLHLTGKPWQGMIRELLLLIKELTYHKESAKNDLFLKEFLLKTGFFLEHRLGFGGRVKNEGKSLKGLLLKLSSLVDGDPNLLAFLNHSLQAIEALQVMNAVISPGGWLMIPLPFLSEDEAGKAEIFIKKESGGHFRVVLFFQLDALGEMMVDIMSNSGLISCHFLLENKDAEVILTAYLDELKTALERRGYYLVNFSVKTGCAVSNEREKFFHLLWSRGERISFFA